MKMTHQGFYIWAFYNNAGLQGLGQ